jgi:hypothetical protein
MVNPALPEVQAALAAVRSELAAVQAERPDAAIEATPNVPPRGVWSSRWRGA